MANITEYTITMKEGLDTYTMRPLILSDKTFFLECFKDFPTEAPTRNWDIQFERWIEHWVEGHEDMEYPIAEGRQVAVAQVASKNDTPIFITYSLYDTNTYKDIIEERDLRIAIHPDQRGKGLYKYYIALIHYYTYVHVKADYMTYDTFDSVKKILKYQKDNNWEYLETKNAGIQGIKHTFKNTKEQYSQNSDYTFSVSKVTHPLTDARYATNYIKSTYIKWDDGLS
jgi:hypothetical protein|tara:strand:+ start:560 stop:1240 length:681 start_codon:yes stop_codon:yes gene_type:complete